MPKLGQEIFAEFHRTSLADQAAVALRESINHGGWGKFLPGEHELARRLSMSRPTVRAALAQLANDGIIKIKKGCRTQLVATRQKVRTATPPTVCLIVPSARESQFYNSHPLLMEMKAQFAVQGIGWEEIFDRRLSRRNPESRLHDIVRGRRHVCWLLISTSATIQQWFQQARVPTLILGSCHEGIVLPSIDVDYRAIGWHAAGCLAQSGHHQVALVTPQRPLAGDLACLHGISEYIQKLKKDITLVEITSGLNRAAFLKTVDRFLKSNQPPTAIFCFHASDALKILIYLLRSGIKVPKNISLLCRDTRPTIDLAIPELTRYRSPVLKQAHHAVRLAQSLLGGHQVPTKPRLIMPAFVPGETLTTPVYDQSKLVR
jgi:DNA-binding LacI/PurR family transcriptional regulator